MNKCDYSKEHWFCIQNLTGFIDKKTIYGNKRQTDEKVEDRVI